MTAEEYFRKGEFKRLMTLCRHKYISLSHIGGSVILKNASDEERKAVGGLLGRVYEGSDIKTTLKEIDKALLNSRFHIGLDELLRLYFKDELITRSDKLTTEKNEKEKFFNDICCEYTDGIAADWLRYMLTKKNVFAKRYNEDRELLRRDIAIVCRALGKLGKPQLLPVFAAEVSGDPHMLDDGTSCGQLFNYAIMYLTGTEQINGASGRGELLEKAGLYSDMVSSFVYCKNIRLYDSIGEHPAYKALLERNEAFTLNIGNLTDIERAEYLNNTVYIVENPAVFTALAQRTENVSLICTAGQPKGACIRLLALSGNTKMYYSGDFDMGGINIAERLFGIFKNIVPWHFGPEDYIKALSDNPLTESALRSLHGLQNGCLKETVQLMIKTGFAGYQENILELLIKDLTMSAKVNTDKNSEKLK